MTDTFTLTLTTQEVNAVLAGLAELPAKVSLGLILKIKEQAEKQAQPAEPVDATE